MTMQCWKSPVPPFCLPDFSLLFFGVVQAKWKETRLSNIPQQNTNSKTNEKRTLHIFRIPNIQRLSKWQSKFQNHTQINETPWTTQKIIQIAKSKWKRPKADFSSHNACHSGYPFFLSPSDDDAMACWKSPIPLPLSTRLFVIIFWVCAGKRKRNATQPNSHRNENSTTSDKRTLHISHESPKVQEDHNADPNFKTTPKSMKSIKQKTKTKHKVKGKTTWGLC